MKTITIEKGNIIMNSITSLKYELSIIKATTRFIITTAGADMIHSNRAENLPTFKEFVQEELEDLKDKLIRKYEKLIKLKEKELEELCDN